MCLMALALGQSSRWPLVLASNRDEFHDRPTLPLSRWTAEGGTEVISGRDLRAGGTWLGCTPGGRIALLTNVREASTAAGPRSRGELPLRWLGSTQDSASFLASTPAADYAGCNLLMGDSLSGAWTWASNRGLNMLNGWQFQALTQGVHGLSNAGLNTPWPKTLALKAALQQAMTAATEANGPLAQGGQAALTSMQARLWEALAKRERAALQDLPDTGIEPALEHGLSSAWVDLPERGYGTRCSSLIWLQADQGKPLRLHVSEKTWGAGNLAPAMAELNWKSPAL